MEADLAEGVADVVAVETVKAAALVEMEVVEVGMEALLAAEVLLREAIEAFHFLAMLPAASCRLRRPGQQVVRATQMRARFIKTL